MFIEVIDKLRCIRQHEDSWLVAKFVEMHDRDLWEGELGCPVCEARYPVREGVVYFSPLREIRGIPSSLNSSQDDLFALAAMLDLSAPERTIVLCDEWTSFTKGLRGISQPHVFVVNGDNPGEPSECVYELVTDDAIPLAPGVVDAIALGAEASPALIESAVRCLREGGRLVGSAGIEIPAGVTMLASDDAKWVAHKVGEFIPLRRASR